MGSTIGTLSVCAQTQCFVTASSDKLPSAKASAMKGSNAVALQNTFGLLLEPSVLIRG